MDPSGQDRARGRMRAGVRRVDVAVGESNGRDVRPRSVAGVPEEPEVRILLYVEGQPAVPCRRRDRARRDRRAVGALLPVPGHGHGPDPAADVHPAAAAPGVGEPAHHGLHVPQSAAAPDARPGRDRIVRQPETLPVPGDCDRHLRRVSCAELHLQRVFLGGAGEPGGLTGRNGLGG